MAGKTPQRAAIYVRISDDREGQGLGVTRQEQDCRALTERLEWTLHPHRPVYSDNDIGASTKSRKARPEFAELLAAVRAGTVDGILYYSTSRLTRRPMEYEGIKALVEDTGVRLASVVSGQVDLTTADGRLLGGIMAQFDAAEAERISERVRRTFVQHREAGRPHTTGTRPFGYKPGGIKVDAVEAAAIRDAVEWITDENVQASLGDVVRAWTAAGLETVTGRPWSRVMVSKVLTRPRNAGLVEYLGEIVGRGSFDAILTEDELRAVREALAARSGLVTARYSRRQHLLSGLIYCGVCGGRMKVSARRDAEGAVRADSFVSCVKDNGGCGHVKRNLRLAEAFILGAVERRLADATAFADPDDDSEAAQEAARLTAERDTLRAKVERLQKLMLDDPDFTAEDFVPMIRKLRDRIREVEALLADVELPARRDALGEDPLADWQAGGFDERREVLEALVAQIVLHPIGKVGPARSRAMVPETTQIIWR
ncbi:recombinase family protein [Geodermatophilus obscurus]|uniref:Resolvase domain protein n=1 Tax=Geodermatophilus obscurus (strain ATCC 25078 / DSM 43160 / JCM 3152 / CCUG 61914 / KCC A-0152 / KCTC 9177 / NBRC 13315 / NRRL B-3577 / G-20) TaxID=526225 RepID=D2SBP9_GEOOG|nr:recombinase family protein [Geodermatophilus obscurus]ADB76156.1 Resolvase domain protein [Geodermatophilus obscurus DSM 43160]